MTHTLIELVKKAVWMEDVHARAYMDDEAIRTALAAGQFGVDCANFVNLVTYLHNGETGPFITVPAVYHCENARYCCGPVLSITNKLNYNERGQWIVQIGEEWWGMTPSGPEIRTLDEWIEYARQSLARVAAAAADPVAIAMAAAPWSARTTPDLEDPPATAASCEVALAACKSMRKKLAGRGFNIELIYD